MKYFWWKKMGFY